LARVGPGLLGQVAAAGPSRHGEDRGPVLAEFRTGRRQRGGDEWHAAADAWPWTIQVADERASPQGAVAFYHRGERGPAQVGEGRAVQFLPGAVA